MACRMRALPKCTSHCLPTSAFVAPSQSAWCFTTRISSREMCNKSKACRSRRLPAPSETRTLLISGQRSSAKRSTMAGERAISRWMTPTASNKNYSGRNRAARTAAQVRCAEMPRDTGSEAADRSAAICWRPCEVCAGVRARATKDIDVVLQHTKEFARVMRPWPPESLEIMLKTAQERDPGVEERFSWAINRAFCHIGW